MAPPPYAAGPRSSGHSLLIADTVDVVVMISVDLPPALLDAAREVLNVSSDSRAIERAVQLVVTRHHQLIAIRGMGDLQLARDPRKIEYPLADDF